MYVHAYIQLNHIYLIIIIVIIITSDIVLQQPDERIGSTRHYDPYFVSRDDTAKSVD